MTRPHEDRLGTGGEEAGIGAVLTWTGTGTAEWTVGGAATNEEVIDLLNALFVEIRELREYIELTLS